MVDASDIVTGAVLVQEDDNQIDHPICITQRNQPMQLLYKWKRITWFSISSASFWRLVTAAEGPVGSFYWSQPVGLFEES